MQPCLRRKVQNRISSALQRRNQVPYYLPDHLWQQWIPAGEFRSSFQTKKERICWVTASQQAKAVDYKNCEARSAEEVKHWFKYQRYSWMNSIYERFIKHRFKYHRYSWMNSIYERFKISKTSLTFLVRPFWVDFKSLHCVLQLRNETLLVKIGLSERKMRSVIGFKTQRKMFQLVWKTSVPQQKLKTQTKVSIY